ncbi:hypothetical protein TAMA11512_16650 [Selenomonas sp. TAMA-11512]|uniref:hypothetical protein n=1 Tax=Selenomonas sp. TAMA-11512 TaxID=3095337 RepID=UPI00308F716A|nr:hypothetical protein TAMA11512_16650 [Selenomonas sp. TAMA-11512]
MAGEQESMRFETLLGKSGTIAKQRHFGEELKKMLRRHTIADTEAKALIDAAMDYMTSYAADAYERGIQEGTVLGYEAGREEALASMNPASEALYRRMLQ